MTIINRPYIQLSGDEAQTIQNFINIMNEIVERSEANSMSDWASRLLDDLCDFFSEYEA